MSDDRKREIDRNLEYFIRELPNLLPVYRGKFAILRHQQIVAYYDTVADAVRAGNQLYLDKMLASNR